MKKFLIFPNTLFNIQYLNKDYEYFIYEHKTFFTSYKFNKKKLMLHRASMKYYADLLKENNFNVKYIEFNDNLPTYDFIYFDPINKINIKNGTKLESPNFIMNKKIYKKYKEKTDKFKFNNFYMWAKKELNLYPELKSLDKYNREKYSDDCIPTIPNISDLDKKYINEAKNYIKKHFNNNYGNVENFIFPISHITSKKWLIDFLKNRLKNFGTYQDFINKDNKYMYHSLLSSMINIGLLNPSEILIELKKYKNKVSPNNFEGYIRQLFWREYQRYCYIYINYNNLNFFDLNKKLTSKWYTGDVGVPVVDDLIKSGFNSGYIHHIGRLMVIGNYMLLNEINPKDGFKWFMEFSCDSYEWVMCQNVYDMVFFISGGITTRKPYISSSNYILKMSNYKKAEWSENWDNLFYSFLKKNKSKLYKFRYYFPYINKL